MTGLDGCKALVWGLLLVPLIGLAQNEVPTQLSNMGGILNTRHNMMQNTEQSNQGQTMNAYRNRYGEVCVYCHTPHAANASVGAPLWNRLLPAGSSFTTYDKLGTASLTQTVYNPGAASLPCLSCHDGSQAVDAILNMPGSGNYSATADPTSWNPTIVVNVPGGYARSAQHRTLSATNMATSCLACHNSDPNGIGGGVATDFSLFAIGKDLRNDHPIGVTFPTVSGPGTDWNTPNGTKEVGTLTTKFFDENSNGRMDKSEIRVYDSGNGASVECGSCHDPHGVAPAAGSPFLGSFLRKSISGSNLCMTCHVK